MLLAARQRKKLATFSKKSVVNSLELLHEHTIASIRAGSDHHSSSSGTSDLATSTLSPHAALSSHATLPDGCIKAVEALCAKFKYAFKLSI